MRDPQEHIAGLGIAFFDETLQRFRQRFVARLVALHNLVAVLVDDEQMVVFVDDLHGRKYNVFRAIKHIFVKKKTKTPFCSGFLFIVLTL